MDGFINTMDTKLDAFGAIEGRARLWEIVCF